MVATVRRSALIAAALWLTASCDGGTLGGETGPGVDADLDVDEVEGCSPACSTAQICRSGRCVEICDELLCPAGWHCEAGTCVQDDPCEGVLCANPGDVCQAGACVAGGSDVDGDGHLARDDCNDNDPTVFPGAPELCNGVNDDCEPLSADGESTCPARCCGFPPQCQDGCCRDDQCGPGGWVCQASSLQCSCAGVTCGDTCYSDGQCCDDEDCPPGHRCGADHRCDCDGVVCDGVCHGGGECCSDEGCSQGRRCEADHLCRCPGVECDAVCYADGACCQADACGPGDWSCDDHRCACAGTVCGDDHCVTAAEGCCSGDDCGSGDWSCDDHRCACDGVVCQGRCFAGESACCFSPVAASPSFASASGVICDLTGVMAEGGTVTGLSISAPGFLTVDEMTVTACVEVDFGRTIDGGTLRTVARASSDLVCGNQCGTECGTGRSIRIFASPDGSAWTHLDTPTITGTLASYEVSFASPFRYGLACRSGAGDHRDHLEVDFMEACFAP